MSRIERTGALLGALAGAALAWLLYRQFELWTVVALAAIPGIHILLAGREVATSSASGRIYALFRFDAALASAALIVAGQTHGWPASKTAAFGLATFLAFPLLRLGGRFDRGVARYRQALAVNPRQQGAAELLLRRLGASVSYLERGGSRELLAEARCSLASATQAVGQPQAARRQWLRAAAEFVSVGRHRTALRLSGARVQPAAPVALPWKEILTVGYFLWAALLGAGCAAAFWYFNREWLTGDLRYWGGLATACAVVALGIPVAGYGLMGGDARWSAVPRLIVLMTCWAALSVGWTAQRLPAAAFQKKPPAAKALALVMSRPVTSVVVAATHFRLKMPRQNTRWIAISLIGSLMLAAAFANPIVPLPDSSPEQGRSTAKRSRKSRRSAAAALAIVQKIEEGADQEAFELAQSALRLGQADDDVLYLAAYLQIKRGEIDGAIEKLSELGDASAPYDTHHHLAVALLTRAFRQLEAGRAEGALEDFRRAGNLNVLRVELPKSLQEVELAAALRELCQLHYLDASGRFESVRDTTGDEVTKLLAQTGLIVTAFQQSRVPKATEIAQVADAASKLWEQTATAADEQLASLFGDAFRRAFLRSQGPVDGRLPRDLHVLAAIAAVSEGQTVDEIKGHAEAALRLDPKSPEAHLIIGLLLQAIDDREGALKHLTIAQQQGEFRELVPMLHELREEVARLKEASKSYFDFLETYLSDPEVPTKIRWALLNDPRIREALRRYAGREETFANMVERAPSLSSYAKRVEILHKERLPRIQEKLGNKERAEVDELLSNMKGYYDQLVTLLDNLQTTEREVLMKTGRFVSGSNGGNHV